VSTLTGTAQLLGLIGRLDRVRFTIWVLVLGLIPPAIASSFLALYETEAARRELVATVTSSPGLVALLGPVHGSSAGALTVWRIGTIGAVLIALMASFTVIRHTRVEEETGRRELIGGAVLGRHAPLLASSIAAIGAGAAIGSIVALGLVGLEEDAAGAVAFGLTWALIAAVFAGVGALAAQLTESAGGARAAAGGVAGVWFALRMVGDGAEASGAGWVSWLSPFGWVSRVEAFGNERWWVPSLFVALAVSMGWAGFMLSARRDVGAGVFPPRPGPPEAAPGLRTPLALAWRLQKSSLVGWVVGVGAFATVWGGLADTIARLVDDNPQMAEIFEALGGAGALTDAFFGAAMGIVALIVSVYVVDVVLTLRSEEDGRRAEPVLATAVGRTRWAGSHLMFAGLGPVLLMAAAGFTAGVTYGIIAGDVPGQVVGLVGAALLHVPAIWVMAGVATVLYGLAPHLSALSWGALVTFLLLGQLGPILQLPEWAMNLSPFTHVPTPPAPVTVVPLVVLALLAGGLVAAGLTGFRTRDLR
jgi:ABC-2 type transport system permease protein